MNVLGSVLPTHVLLPAMMDRNEGKIVFISSQAGQVLRQIQILVDIMHSVLSC